VEYSEIGSTNNRANGYVLQQIGDLLKVDPSGFCDEIKLRKLAPPPNRAVSNRDDVCKAVSKTRHADWLHAA